MKIPWFPRWKPSSPLHWAWYWLGYALLLGLLVYWLPEDSHGDRWYWMHWTRYCFEHELGSIYSFRIDGHVLTNYHPLYLHFLNAFSGFFSDWDTLYANLYRIKIFALGFDFLGALARFLILPREQRRPWLPLFLLLNLAYLYNSIVWGQIDSVFTVWSLLALIFGLRQRPDWAIVCYLLALNTKLQSIIFLPLVGLVLLPSLRLQWRRVGWGLLTAGLVQLLLLWPFIRAGQLPVMWQTLTTGSVDLYPRTSLSAFNFWYLFFGDNTLFVSDREYWGGWTYKQWGLLLFCLSSALSLLPLALRSLACTWRGEALAEDSAELVFLTACLVAVGFFYFNTQMHERYSHPALLMAFYYGALRGRYLLYLLLSLAYFLNLERVMQAFEWDYRSLWFQPEGVALLFGLVLLLGLGALYRPRGPDRH